MEIQYYIVTPQKKGKAVMMMIEISNFFGGHFGGVIINI